MTTLSPPVTIIAGLGTLFGRLKVPWRRRAALLVVMTFIGAIAELTVIGAIVPFLAIIASPDGAHLPRALGGVLRSVTGGRDHLTLQYVAAIFVSVAIVAAVVRLALARLMFGTISQLGHEITVKIFERVINQPYSFHIEHNSSYVLLVVNMVVDVTHNIILPIVQSFSSIVIILFVLIGLFALDPLVAGSTLLLFGTIYIGISFYMRGKILRNGRAIHGSVQARFRIMQESVGGIRDVILDHAQSVYVAKLALEDRIYYNRTRDNIMSAAAPRLVIESLGMILIALLAIAMSSRAGGVYAALPVLGALAIGAQRMMPLFQVIYQSWAQITGVRPSFEQLLGVAALELDPVQPSIPLPFAESLDLRGVSFDYGNRARVLDDVHLTIPRGTKVAFIGKTGSGKTTLVDIIMGLLEPTDGDLCVDGNRLDADGRRGWQENIAHVSQTTYLADTTLAANIAFGIDPARIDMDRLRAATDAAAVTQFIDTLPDGFETSVGERGVRLSGGQRQRIGIARALYKRSPVLILDEATSALDDATEAVVMANLEAQGDGLTLIIIAHRLSTVERCDTVYRLEAGRIVAHGSFAEVVGRAASAQ